MPVRRIILTAETGVDELHRSFWTSLYGVCVPTSAVGLQSSSGIRGESGVRSGVHSRLTLVSIGFVDGLEMGL